MEGKKCVSKEFKDNVRISPTELDLLMRLASPNLARAEKLVMTGETLRVIMPHYGTQLICASPTDLLDYARQIQSGVEHLHERNILHLDISNANVLVDEAKHVTLIDFGHALLIPAGVPAVFDTTERTSSRFRAPEVGPRTYPGNDMFTMGFDTYDVSVDPLLGFVYAKAVDLYSCGSVLMHALSGYIDDHKDEEIKLSTNFEHAVQCLLATDPALRKFSFEETVTVDELEVSRKEAAKTIEPPAKKPRLGVYIRGGVMFNLTSSDTQEKDIFADLVGTKWNWTRGLCDHALRIRPDICLGFLAIYIDIIYKIKRSKKRDLTAAFVIALNYANSTYMIEEYFTEFQLEINSIFTILADLKGMILGNTTYAKVETAADLRELMIAVLRGKKLKLGATTHVPLRKALLRDFVFKLT